MVLVDSQEKHLWVLSWGGCSFPRACPGPLLGVLHKGLVPSAILLIPKLQAFLQDQIGSWALNDLPVPLEETPFVGVNCQLLLEVNMIHEKGRTNLSLNVIGHTKKSQQGVSCLRATCDHQAL